MLPSTGPCPPLAHARALVRRSLFALAVVSIYTPLKFPYIAERWFADMHWLSLSPVPLATSSSVEPHSASTIRGSPRTLRRRLF